MIVAGVAPRIDFDPGLHRYHIEGRHVPSVTQVLDHLNDWSHVPAIDLECARALGREVHEACNLMVRAQLDFTRLDPAIRPYVDGAQKFLQENEGVILASELRMGSSALGFAGTLDLLLEQDTDLWVIDWKTSQVVPTTVGAQTAAYEILFNCMRDPTFRPWMPRPRVRRCCVRLGMGTYRIQMLNDFRKDWNDFSSCLNTWQLRERKYG